MRNYLKNIFAIKNNEFVIVAWSFLYFFSLLAAYYLLRPVRDAMAIVGGVQNIPWLFTGTFLIMLLVSPLFSLIASRYPRKIFLPWVYYFFILNILFFFLAFTYSESNHIWIARVFFIWISVFNLFVVSVFWSFMADIYNKDQSRRLFGLISAGGSIGAIIGPIITSSIVVFIGFKNLLPISAILILLAVFCIHQLKELTSKQKYNYSENHIRSEEPIGGTSLDGIRLMLKMPYFRMISGSMILSSFLGVTIYMYMAELVNQNYSNASEHTQIFAIIDTLTNTLSLISQLFFVRYSIKKLGVGVTLTILPIVSTIGFILLSINPIFIILVIFQILRRSIGFGFSKPTSDILYTVVSRNARYKTKNFIETAVFRGGDLIATWVIKILNLGLSTISLICIPVTLIGVILTLLIGAQYNKFYKKLSRKTNG